MARRYYAQEVVMMAVAAGANGEKVVDAIIAHEKNQMEFNLHRMAEDLRQQCLGVDSEVIRQERLNAPVVASYEERLARAEHRTEQRAFQVLPTAEHPAPTIEEMRIYESQGMVAAVKAYRHRAGVSLMAGKEVIERHAIRNGYLPKPV